MAKKEGYVVDINKLWRYDDTTGDFVAPKALWANGKEYYAAFSNGEMTFNKANYELYLEDTTLIALADGTIVDPYVYYSRKTDFDGTITEVEVTDTIGEIKPNYTDQEVNGTFEITQKISNFILTGTYRQRKDSSNDEYYDLRITYIVCPLIPAGGGSRPLTIGYSVIHRRRYESGKLEEETINNTTAAFESATVSTTSKSSFNASTGKLSGDSLGKVETPESSIATVKYVKISLHGLTAEWNGSQSWYQEANTIEYNTTYEAWSYAEPDPLEDDTIGVEGGVILFHGRAYQRITGIWTSGEPADTTTVTEPLYFSTNYGTFPNGSTRYTMMDEGTIELRVGSTDEDRIISVNVNNAYAGYSEEYRYRQSAKEFVGYDRFVGFLEASVGYEQAPAWGGSVSPSVTVFIKMCAVYSDGSYDESDWIKTTAKNVRVTSASNTTDDYKNMASLNRNNGVVTVNNLGTTVWENVHTVFVVNSMSGLFDAEGVYDRAWSWNGTAIIEQEENIQNYTGEVGYTYEADIQPDTLEGSDTTISVDYEAWQHTYYYWNSNPSNMLSDDVAQWLYIRITGSATASKDVKGSGTYTYDVGTVGTTDRTFHVAVTNNSGEVVASSTITQLAPTSFHYELVRVDDAGVSYEEAFAWANSVSPYIQVRAWYKKVWSNGVEDPNLVYEDHYSGESGFTIAHAAGQAKNSSGATINSSTGVVSVKSLGETPTSQRPVFEVQTLYGTFMSSLVNKSLNWQMNDFVIVEQAENQYHDDGDPFYEYTSSIKPSDTAANGELSPVDTEITVYGTARIGQKYYWDSYGDARKTAYTNSVLKVMLNRNFEDVRDLKGANASTTFNVGINSSTTTQRTFLVEVYDTEGRYNQSYYLTQQENSAQEYWEAPTLNGAIQVEDIPASGEAVLISVPIKQVKKRRVEGSSTSEVVTTYTGSVIAVAVEGQALSGAGVSFNNGYISANNLGTSDISRGTVYTLKVVTVTGQDSKTYSLTLPSWVEIKQAANTWEEVIISSAVDMTPLSGSFDVLGGSKTLMVYATNYSRKEYASGANSGTTANAAAVSLSATNGSISPTSMTTTVNGKAATLSVTENIAAAKTISVKATVNPGGSGEKSITASFSQPAVSYAFSSGSDKDCNGTASTVYVTFTSSRNGKAWQPSFTTSNADATIDTSNITMSGNVYTVPVIIKANPTTSSRDIVITATQTRYNGSATQNVTITQAGAASAVIRTVDAYGSWNSGGTAVINITAYLSNDSSSRVTFSGIKVELRRRLKTQGYNPESAELVTTASYSGSVSVGAGGSSNVSISNITHTRSSSYYYWLVAYATQTTETTYNEIEEYEPEG